MAKKQPIPGIVRPTAGFRSTDRKERPRTIQEKRATVIRSIERHLRGEPRAARLEVYDPEQRAPVIRVLYGSAALPVFDGQPAAIIDPDADRGLLWASIVERIEGGDFDEQIEARSREMTQSMAAAKLRNEAA